MMRMTVFKALTFLPTAAFPTSILEPVSSSLKYLLKLSSFCEYNCEHCFDRRRIYGSILRGEA
jgi:hypothetical protein